MGICPSGCCPSGQHVPDDYYGAPDDYVDDWLAPDDVDPWRAPPYPREIPTAPVEMEILDSFVGDLCEVVSKRTYGEPQNHMKFENGRLVSIQLRNKTGGIPSATKHIFVGNSKEIQQCRKLKVLDVSQNTISHFPQWLGNLSGLERLEICHNKMPMQGAVPTSMNALQKLSHFSLFNAQLKGAFEPMELFTRMCRDSDAELVLCGNCFDSVDFCGEQFTDGILRPCDPAKSMCVASFCGAEFLEWRKLLHRAECFQDWSQLCVFLADYATAQKTCICDPSWHAGGCKDSKECKKLGRFFEMAAKDTNNASISSHEQFGCKWFERWCGNIMDAVKKGHTRFVVFTKPDLGIGTCQRVEWCFLTDLCRQNPRLQLNICNVADLDEVLQMGVRSYGEMHFPEWLDEGYYDYYLRYMLKRPGFPFCEEDFGR